MNFIVDFLENFQNLELKNEILWKQISWFILHSLFYIILVVVQIFWEKINGFKYWISGWVSVNFEFFGIIKS